MSFANDAIDKWCSFFDYDPDRTEFNLASSIFSSHYVAQRASKLLEFDKSGVFSVLYLKNYLYDYASNTCVNLFDIAKDQELQSLTSFLNLWNIFHSKDMKDVENGFGRILSDLSIDLVESDIVAYIGDMNTDSFLQKVSEVIESTLKLNETVYSIGDAIKPVKVSKKFHVFNSILESVETISGYPDGIYFSYIYQANQYDGFFGLWFKSNGNLFSLDDRCEEVYPGQNRNRRSDRYLESKGYNLFPYEFLRYDKDKNSILFDSEIESFSDFPDDYVDRLIIALSLIILKYNNTVLDSSKQVIVDSIISHIKQSDDVDSKSIMKLSESSIVPYHKEFIHLFDDWNSKQIISGTIPDVVVNSNATYYKDIVDHFSKGFEPDINLAVTCGFTSNQLPGDSDINEYVASSDDFRKVVFMNLRNQLKDYVDSKVQEEFNQMGGWEYYFNEYSRLVNLNIERILEFCAISYINEFDTHGLFSYIPYRYGEYENQNLIRFLSRVLRVDSYFSANYIFDYNSNSLVRPIDKDKDMVDPRSGTSCNIIFKFKPVAGLDIKRFLGCDIPRLIECWDYNGSRIEGNPILDITDPFTGVSSPFYQTCGSFSHKNNPRYAFDFCIPMSKRTLRNYISQYAKKCGISKDEISQILKDRKSFGKEQRIKA